MLNWPAARRLEDTVLAAILLLALALRLWGLERNGWGAEYYSAAVRSMALGFHNFFFAAFDPEGFISVDKPPVALWLQVAGVKLLGFRPLGVLLPQVLEGVLSVWVLFRIVRRRFSAQAALLAALFMAVTPILVAVNRTNNTDSCLLLALLLATWAFMRAVEEGSRRWLLVAMAAVGVAFNVKMLAAFIVLPTFFAIYFIGAPVQWRRRVADLTLATVVLAATALPWVLAYELTPADSRPWVGSSTKNSMLELLVGANGIERFVSRLKRPAAAPTAAPAPVTEDGAAPARSRSIVSRLFVRTPTGPLRLADGQLAAQVAWLLPLAVAALLIGAFQNRFRRPLAPEHLALLFWLLWLLNYAVVYSYAGGTMHFYYLATLAPALAALAGIGVANLWAWQGHKGWRAFMLPVALALTALWQLRVEASALGWTFDEMLGPVGEWLRGLHLAFAIAGLAAALVLAAVPLLRAATGREWRMGSAGALALGLAALLAVPMAWTLSSVLQPGHGVLPSADLVRLAPSSGVASSEPARAWFQSADTSRLVGLLQDRRTSERFLLATTTTHLADAIIISSGEAVMARGGFHGLDRAVSPQRLAQMVQDGDVRFAMVGDAPSVSRRLGADAAGQPVDDWIRANGKPVPGALWRARGIPYGAELYDLYTDPALAP